MLPGDEVGANAPHAIKCPELANTRARGCLYLAKKGSVRSDEPPPVPLPRLRYWQSHASYALEAGVLFLFITRGPRQWSPMSSLIGPSLTLSYSFTAVHYS
jgi:hypothetical protein